MSTISNNVTIGVTLGLVDSPPTYTSPLTITSTGRIDVSNGNAVYAPINYSDLTLVNQGTITAAAGYGVDLANGGYVDNAGGLISGRRGVAIYGGGSAANTGTVVGTGTTAGDAGVRLNAGGSVANTGTGLIQGFAGVNVYTNAGTVTNAGTIVGNGGDFSSNAAVDFNAGGSVNNTGLLQGYRGVEIYSAAGTITNSGTIASTGTGFSADGVYLKAGGSVANNGGLITGYYEAIEASGGAVTNSGQLTSFAPYAGWTVKLGASGGSVDNQAGGLIAGGHAAIGIFGTGTVTNAGTILGTNGKAVALYAGGSVGNTAQITGASGVYIGAVVGTVVNSGTIVGTSGVGVTLGAGGTIVNSGTIGGTSSAVLFGGSSNLLELAPGYGLVGGVLVSGTGNVLEFASGSGTGTISGLGSVFTNFATITIDAGASWVLSGNNTLGSGVTLTDFGTLTNAGSLDASAGSLIADPASFINSGLISGTVTLSGGGTLDNQAGGTISTAGVGVRGTLAAATVVNAGTILGNFPVTGANNAIALYNGGSIANNAGYIRGYNGVGIAGAYGIVTNTGTIFGTVRQGVGFGAGGSVGNSGLIRGYLGGVYIGGGVGMVTNSGLILAFYGYGVRLAAGGTVINSGSIRDAAPGFTAVAFGGTGSNLLVLQSGYHFQGAVVGSATATDTVELAGTVGAAVTASYNGLTLSNFENVLFGAGGYSTLLVSNAGTPGTLLGVTISGFDAATEVIDLTGVGADGAITNFDTATDQITVTGSSGSLTLQFDSIDGFNFTASPDSSGGTDLSPVCYCRGTMILTDRGEVAVEDLKIGDRVMTLSGEVRPVRWIGRRAYDGRLIAGNRDVLPIRVMAGALADGVPARDLRVSPDHSLYLDGVLVTARQLLNGATITQETSVDAIEYFHVELDTHDVIFADGAPAESYVECDNRGRFQNAAEFALLYPNDDRPGWRFCVPLAQWDSEEPNAIREALLGRAEALGHRLDLDPDLHLIVDGAAVPPDSVNGGVYCFTIPAGSEAASLASRSTVPAEVTASARDLRRLGVPVERLVLYDGDLLIEAWHGHAGLSEGFHDDEPSHRWTNSLARLPQSWLRSFPGACTLEVHLITAELPYRLAAPSRTRAVA